MTWRDSPRRLLVLWLLPCLLVACANVLGIEERRADVAANYPEAGYAGCLPGNCSGCLDVHRRECEVRAVCAETAGREGCAACVCQSCTEQLVECQLDGGCSAVWECLRETRCDLSERAAGNCLDTCGSVIQDNGGVNGSAWRSAIAIRTCAASASCLSCLAPQVQQSTRNCTQQDGCQDCDDCFRQCLCSGERFGVCQDACGDQSPPSDCSDENDCANCSNCFDACTCNGISFQQCSEVCSPPGSGTACTLATGCVDCADCAAQCVCSGGGDAAECSALCGPPSAEDACEKDPGGESSICGGCNSCLARCTCNGTPLTACLESCGHHECCDDLSCAGGDGSVSACSCDSTAESCFQGVYGSCDNFFDCDSCACQQCPGQLGVCLDVPGCKSTFDCLRNTECHGSACLERCGGNTTQEAFAVAEALWACYHGADCSCNTAPSTTACPSAKGSVNCVGYQSASATLPACCPEAVISGGQSEPVGTSPDSNPCGLELSRYFRSARACEPREQASPPRFALLEGCPDQPVGGDVYNGATLRGCCRAADSTCGYYDDVTGLGCLSASIFGNTPQPCP